MIVKLQVGLELKAPVFYLHCVSMFPGDNTGVQIMSANDSKYRDYDLYLAIDHLDFFTVDSGGRIWFETTPPQGNPAVLKMVFMDGELVNAADLNPALEPMGVC